MSLTPDQTAPYLSVVVAPCEDNDGGPERDPVERLQLFLDCLDEQCRRTGLDAEVIVVDWNRRLAGVEARLRLPDPPFCTYRFFEVPPEVHNRLRHADVLQAFPMIARNVGIRRARGRFVLATSIDVVLPMELVSHLASRSLKPGRLYRADRHDVDADVPSDAPLERKLSYWATHRRRIHARSGVHAVDRNGSVVSLADDIVDGRAVRLGEGWHVLEGDRRTGAFRWAHDRAEVVVETGATATPRPTLELDVEANPYDRRAWVKLEVREGERAMSRTHVTGRMQLRVPLDRADREGPRRLELRVTETHANPRVHLPAFERRDEMTYRVHSMKLGAETVDPSTIQYPLAGWMNANPRSAQTVTQSAEGLIVATDPPKWSYSMKYGMLQAPASGTYRFEVSCSVLEGRVLIGVLNGTDTGWIPVSVTVRQEGDRTRFDLSVVVGRNEQFWLMIYNDHPEGAGVSRFIVHGMTGSVDPARLVGRPVAGLLNKASLGRVLAAAELKAGRLRRSVAEAFSPEGRRERILALVDSTARIVIPLLPVRLRELIVRAAPEYRSIERAFNVSAEQARILAPLQDLSPVQTLLRRHRPKNLHVTGCGDFQLMAREHWHDLQGYAEFEAFSDNVDSLLSFSADAAGIEEHVLPAPIYHLERDGRSSSSRPPADEDVIGRQRMAERGVPRLDSGMVAIWASQMSWLQRPMTFNSAAWGMAGLELPERTIVPALGSL